jgi:FecR-like protein
VSDDYLWDGSGEPDPEIERLESRLARYRHQAIPLRLPERSQWRLWLVPSLAAATLALVVMGVWIGWRPPTTPSPPTAIPRLRDWSVTSIAGSPSVEGRKIGEAGRLAVGERLETDAASSAVVNVSSVGQLEIEPNTQLRLLETRQGAERVALDRGVIHAMIWAPPGEFVVRTPSALAVDLGCAYTLKVDDRGAGVIRVTFGWVGFKLGRHESFIPEGAVCATRPGTGPGTPHFEDCSKSFSRALERLDFGSENPAAGARDLKTVLAEARPRDALTLWHLLTRVEGGERLLVYHRLAAYVPPPAGVTEQGVLGGDPHMLDMWWDKLGYGEMSWWRQWERNWTEPAN